MWLSTQSSNLKYFLIAWRVKSYGSHNKHINTLVIAKIVLCEIPLTLIKRPKSTKFIFDSIWMLEIHSRDW